MSHLSRRIVRARTSILIDFVSSGDVEDMRCRTPSRRASLRILASLAATLVAAGCSGIIDAAPPGSGPGGSDPNRPGSPSLEGPASARIWRLTRVQYDATITELLGDTSGLAQEFLQEISATGFDTGSANSEVAGPVAAQFRAAARSLATVAVSDRLDRIFPCGASSVDDDGCVEDFVRTFGRKAFRRPLSTEEHASYVALYRVGRSERDGTTGIALVVEAMLQSPNFLYRTELGDGGVDAPGEVRMTAHEIASFLSYGLWNGPPDAALDAAADSGALLEPAEQARQVERMLADDRARGTLRHFYYQLFELRRLRTMARDASQYPSFADQLPHLGPSLLSFADHVTWDGEGTLDALLSARYAYVNGPLAELFGVSSASLGSELQRVSVDGSRGGAFLHPAILSAGSNPDATSPVRRGLFVLERFLCRHVPAPPPDAPMTPPSTPGLRTTRERFEAHTTDDRCAACHRAIDPIGFGFEAYDPIGRFRDEENGATVDASGELDLDDRTIVFDGAEELVQALASSPTVRRCFATQVFRFTIGRKESRADAAMIDALAGEFERQGRTIVPLVRAVVLADPFVRRFEP